MGVSVQTRFDTTLNGAISDVATTLVLDDAPAFTKGYGTLERGTVNEEDVYWDNLSGLQLTSMLRGLSKTALTNTEVSGNKKAHLDGAVFEGTLLHYIVNDKASKSGDETISGQWVFTQLPTSSDTPSGATDFVTKGYVDTADALKANLAGGNTWTGAQSFTGATVTFADDGAETATNAAPTSDKKLANKKYVDDKVVSGLASNSVVDHEIYTPAFLTGGAAPTNNYLLWLGTSDGSLRITIDGVLWNVTGIDFTSGVTSMNDVAAKIQAKIRTTTGSTETCTWNGSRFIISSADTTSSSAITVLSAAGVGTDISGAGATSFMDSDTGNGTVTNKALNPTADAGKIAKTAADGFIDGTPTTGLIPDLFLRYTFVNAKGDILTASGDNTPAIQTAGANGKVLSYDSAQANGLAAVGRSRKIATNLTATTVGNTTSELPLFTTTVAGGLLGTADGVRGRIYITDYDQTNVRNLLIRMKYGATTISTMNVTAPASTLTNWGGVIDFEMFNNASASAQTGALYMHISVNTNQIDLAGKAAYSRVVSGTATENSAGDLTFQVTAQWDGAAAGATLTGLPSYLESIES